MRPDFIETHSGRAFRPLAPDSADIVISDIAHALSRQCRFSGHTREHYSVAEHSVRVSELLQWQGHSKRKQLWGLLHDASEAYLVDIPLPLKCAPEFAPYRRAEERLMAVICRRFGLTVEEPAAVREADAILLATEARDLMPFRAEHWGSLKAKPLGEVIVPWSFETAERNFLQRYVGLAA
jgi:hypothetical protein